VKSPRIYVRDSGLTHALLRIPDYNRLSGHPVFGASWEGFIIENILSTAPEGTRPSFYRTSVGAETDLVLNLPDGKRWAIEIKSGLEPKVGKGFYNAIEDIKSNQSYLVFSGTEGYPISNEINAIGLEKMLALFGIHASQSEH
jgi:hypothetical protein